MFWLSRFFYQSLIRPDNRGSTVLTTSLKYFSYILHLDRLRLFEMKYQIFSDKNSQPICNNKTLIRSSYTFEKQYPAMFPYLEHRYCSDITVKAHCCTAHTFPVYKLIFPRLSQLHKHSKQPEELFHFLQNFKRSSRPTRKEIVDVDTYYIARKWARVDALRFHCFCRSFWPFIFRISISSRTFASWRRRTTLCGNVVVAFANWNKLRANSSSGKVSVFKMCVKKYVC